MRAYKLFRLDKDGGIHSLFISSKTALPLNKWMHAECVPTKGFAVRRGWHCCFTPNAPHLKMQLSNGERRVWGEVEVDGYTTYNRPESQGGSWILAENIRIIKTID